MFLLPIQHPLEWIRPWTGQTDAPAEIFQPSHLLLMLIPHCPPSLPGGNKCLHFCKQSLSSWPGSHSLQRAGDCLCPISSERLWEPNPPLQRLLGPSTCPRSHTRSSGLVWMSDCEMVLRGASKIHAHLTILTLASLVRTETVVFLSLHSDLHRYQESLGKFS